MNEELDTLDVNLDELKGLEVEKDITEDLLSLDSSIDDIDHMSSWEY